MVLGSVALAADAGDPAGRTGGAPLTTKKITLTNPSAGHTYNLYQIFTGTFKSIDGNDTLGDIAFGNGIKMTEGKYGGKTAEELAKTITNSEAGARAFANTVDADLQNGTAKTAANAMHAPIGYPAISALVGYNSVSLDFPADGRWSFSEFLCNLMNGYSGT